MFYAVAVAQLSFFSADASAPSVADLAGVLCGPGQLASFAATAARLSVLVDERWRAEVLAAEFARRGVDAEVASSDAGHALVRTAFRADLIPLAAAWSRGAVKAVPPDLRLDGPMLRLWLLASGRRPAMDAPNGAYLLGLDPRAPDTHEPLVRAARGLGLLPDARAGATVGVRGGGPAVRVTGAKRLRRLAELAGAPPSGAEHSWPAALLPTPTA